MPVHLPYPGSYTYKFMEINVKVHCHYLSGNFGQKMNYYFGDIAIPYSLKTK